MTICPREWCTGCGMCENLCPHGAIKMINDAYGFCYPSINADICTKCDLCSKKCPQNSKTKKLEQKQDVYAAWNRNSKTRKSSTSGGVFSVAANKIFENGGIVFGVEWDENFNTRHCAIKTPEDLYRINGSKYVQSATGDVYKQVKESLLSGVLVLFSGTPCQVAALKSFLGKTYKNLYTIDVVCHGVPSYEVFNRHLKEISGNNVSDIKNVFLRYKKPCWNFSSVKIDFCSGKSYITPTVEDAYFNLFNFNFSLRESCHNCKYTSVNRESDITLCDFWGYSPKSFRMSDFDKGVSGVLINTEKGKKLFSEINNSMVFEKKDISDIKKGNRCLEKPFDAPPEKDDFWQDFIEGMPVSELNNKYIKKPFVLPKLLWLRRLKRSYKWIIGR